MGRQLNTLGHLDLVERDAVVDAKVADIHVEAVRNVFGVGENLDLMRDVRQHTTLVLDSVRVAVDGDRHVGANLLALLDGLQVEVHQPVGEWVDLGVLDDRHVRFTINRYIDQDRVLAPGMIRTGLRRWPPTMTPSSGLSLSR